MLVRFDVYCRNCQHKDVPEEKDPCDMCLAVPAREETKKPLCYEEKEKK